MGRVIKILCVFVISVILSPLVTYASANTETIDYTQIAKDMIANYDAMQKKEVNPKEMMNDPRFTNDMVEKQEKLHSELVQKIEKSKKNKEKFYSMKEILNASAEDFGISNEDMQRIKQCIIDQQTEDTNLLNAFDALGESNHPIAKMIKKDKDTKLPKSLIYVDHSKDKQDGKISGGGWPYCLDDNGYGYKNFITSDCYKAIVGYLLCASDSSLGKMDSNLRYCKAYYRNCSPLIGHSKYWHTHSWYQKIP